MTVESSKEFDYERFQADMAKLFDELVKANGKASTAFGEEGKSLRKVANRLFDYLIDKVVEALLETNGSEEVFRHFDHARHPEKYTLTVWAPGTEVKFLEMVSMRLAAKAAEKSNQPTAVDEIAGDTGSEVSRT